MTILSLLLQNYENPILGHSERSFCGRAALVPIPGATAAPGGAPSAPCRLACPRRPLQIHVQLAPQKEEVQTVSTGYTRHRNGGFPRLWKNHQAFTVLHRDTPAQRTEQQYGPEPLPSHAISFLSQIPLRRKGSWKRNRKVAIKPLLQGLTIPHF